MTLLPAAAPSTDPARVAVGELCAQIQGWLASERGPFTRADFAVVPLPVWRQALRHLHADRQIRLCARGVWGAGATHPRFPDRPAPVDVSTILAAEARRTGETFGMLPAQALQALRFSTHMVMQEIRTTTDRSRRLRLYPDALHGPRWVILRHAPAWHFAHLPLNPVLAALDGLHAAGTLKPCIWAHLERQLPAERWADLATLQGLPSWLRRSRAKYLAASFPPRAPHPAHE